MYELEVEQTKPNSSWVSFKRQITATIGIFIGSICYGYTKRLMQINYAYLTFPSDEINVSTRAHLFRFENFITSLWIPLSVLLGVLSLRCNGRRSTLRLSYVMWFLGFFCLFLTETLQIKQCGYYITQFSIMLFFLTSLIYVYETCDSQKRAPFMMVLFVCHYLGELSNEFANELISFTLFSLATAFLLSFLCPETYTWLLSNFQIRKAKKNYFWLRGLKCENGREDLLLPPEFVIDVGGPDVCSLLLNSKFYVTFLRLLCVLIFLASSTTRVVEFFAENTIFLEMKNQKLIALGLGLVSCYIITSVRSRTHFLFSAVASLVSIVIFNIYNYGIITEIYITCWTIMLISQLCFVYTGVLQVPWILAAEMYADNSRDAGLGLTYITLFYLRMIVRSLTDIAVQYYDGIVTISFEMGTLLFCIIFSLFCVPKGSVKI